MHFIQFVLWKGSADTSPIWGQGFGPFVETGFRAFHRAKISI